MCAAYFLDLCCFIGGLLAGLWEFPTVPFLSSNGEKKIQLLGHLRKFLSEDELSEVEIRESKTVSKALKHTVVICCIC